MGEEDEKDQPELSAATFSALAEFYREQEERDQLQQEAARVEPVTLDWKEDWQLSQFWYTEDTAASLASAVMSVVGEGGSVACVSAPTLYRALKVLDTDNRLNLKLLEFDNRFAAFGQDFCFYDYRSPLDLDRGLRESFDLVFADPPFLSEECLTKTAVTVKFLSKEKVVLCTGAVMASLADRLLGLSLCKFSPQHTNNLANQFQCFANFNLDHHIELSSAGGGDG